MALTVLWSLSKTDYDRRNHMLYFTKSFKRKINVGLVSYVVEQNGITQTLSIYKKSPKTYVYMYNAKDNVSQFSLDDLETIKYIFEQAHVERYVLTSPH